MSKPLIQAMPVADARSEPSTFRPMLQRCSQPSAGHSNTDQSDDPYARGLTDGQTLAEVAFAVERQQLMNLIAAAQALQPEPSEELAQLIAEAVYGLVQQIVDDAPISRAWLEQAAMGAASAISDADAARTAWLHPDDITLLANAQLPLTLMADNNASRGSIRIDCSEGWVEHGRSIFLDALRGALTLDISA